MCTQRKMGFLLSVLQPEMLYNHFLALGQRPYYACILCIQFISSFMMTGTTAKTIPLNRSSIFCHWYLGWNCSTSLGAACFHQYQEGFWQPSLWSKGSMCVGRHGGEMQSKMKLTLPICWSLNFSTTPSFSICSIPYVHMGNTLDAEQSQNWSRTVPPCSLSHSEMTETQAVEHISNWLQIGKDERSLNLIINL